MEQMLASSNLADGYLNIALQHDMLEDFLVGSSLFALKSKDGYGNLVFSSMHVMEAIYKKYKNEDKTLSNKVYETLLKVLQNSKYPQDIFNVTDNIIYQIYSEKEGKAPFLMNNKVLLEALKNNLSQNKEFYQYSDMEHNIQSVWPQVEEYNERVFQSSGQRII